ncbi:hypothetical protein E8E14_001892 [Neopestalotiopsis sp. 37M]|nr:hypothetical protein E8E14_001892 [Neopestalotiopsis sp. 37M]
MRIDGIGIDLGTAETRVAIFRNGEPEIIPDVDGGDSFPSVVGFDRQNHTRMTGSRAKHQSSSSLSLVFRDIKRRIESRHDLSKKGGRRANMDIVEAVAAIFDRVMGNVATYCKLSLETMTFKAVISVPALFNEQQRQIIRDAAKVVGIEILSLIATPSAICYAWAVTDWHAREDAKTQILALDMGASRFHAAVANFEYGCVEMQAMHQVKLGGNDLENIVYNYLTAKAEEMGILVGPKSRAERRLRSACQKAIIELSFAQKHHIVLESLADDKTFDFSIDRATFDKVIATPKGWDHFPLLLQSTPLSVGVGLSSGEFCEIMSRDLLVPNKQTKTFTWDKSLGLTEHRRYFKRNGDEPEDITDQEKVDKIICFYQGESSQCRDNLFLMKVDLTDALSEPPDPQQRTVHISVDMNVNTGIPIEVSMTLDSGPTISKRLELSRLGLKPIELDLLQKRLRQYKADDKLEETRKAQRYTIDEKLAGLRRLSTGLSQLREAIDREASWMDDHPSASVENQQAMLQRLDALTELALRYSKETEEQIGDTPLEPEVERTQDSATDRLRAEDITFTPIKDYPLVDDSSCGNTEIDIPLRSNEEPQEGDATFRPRAQQVRHMHLSYSDSDNSTNRITVELESLFSTSSQGVPGIYTDVNFARISVYLRNTGHASWSATPRLYTALRLVDHVDALDEFLELGLNDMCFPFTNTTMPVSLSPTIKSAFLDIQETVYSESKSYDVGHGKHVYFSKYDPKPFQTIGLLGKGGHGTVDKVMSQLDQKEYARKLFRRVRGWSQSHIESFRTEVNVLKRVDHIHCVQLISTYSDPKFFALLMKPAGDCNLARYYELAQNNNDKLSLLRGFLGCLTSGVRYLHDSKIRHRDIKPQNVIIKDDQVYLTDFGIAYSWENLAGATTTADSAKTAIYAAPEVIRVEPRNTSADIWSLGCIFFEIATVLSGGSVEDLKAYFQQQTGTEAYHANVENFAAWVKGLRSSSASKSDIFSWKLAHMALQFDPDDRLTAAELFEEIAEETHRVGVHFCGPCCLDEDTSTIGSEAGSVDESWP